ncbi:hypothetical protein M2139_001552 [Enterococcus sp. PF1-24]|uniref:DUF6056 family protein n=1 Tax=unclassified Enterococcus TaxID=2608891 RepID=UPI0024758613|nr:MULTISPECIES: DUF6056 family protein [unclassified Enterococcus]MDH6364565.1 hypothetical protein [Enterococcus sp. PFB1-1]MDH6401666.1 hypothetical protein [Enterococcus sp. PF1-24]
MKTTNEKIRNSSGIILLCLLLAYLIYFNFSIKLTGYGDDNSLFLEPLMKNFSGDIGAFLANRYQTWSARLVIEFFVLISVQHYTFWRIGNTLAMFIIIAMPALMVRKKLPLAIGLIFSVTLFNQMPLGMFSETGWISTSVNYLWVLAAGWLVVYPLLQLANGKNVFILTYLLSLLALVFASNSEQMAAILLAFTAGCLFYSLFQKKVNVFKFIPYFIINIGNLLLILLAPGNRVRLAEEVPRWFPDFNKLSLFRKIELGYSSTVRNLFFDGNRLTLVLIVVLIIVALKKKAAIWQQIWLWLSLALWLVFGPLQQTLAARVPYIANILSSFNNYGTTFQLSELATWQAEIWLTLALACFILGVVMVMESGWLKLTAAYLLLIAIAARMALGFSPTIWASGMRTYTFTYQLFITTVLLALADNHKFLLKDLKKSKLMLLCAFVFVCFGIYLILQNLYTL